MCVCGRQRETERLRYGAIVGSKVEALPGFFMPCLSTQTLLDCLSIEPKPPTHTCANRHAEIHVSSFNRRTDFLSRAPTQWNSLQGKPDISTHIKQSPDLYLYPCLFSKDDNYSGRLEKHHIQSSSLAKPTPLLPLSTTTLF